MKKNLLVLTALLSIAAALSAVVAIVVFYSIFEYEVRSADIIAASVLPLLTVPFIVISISRNRERIFKLEKELDIQQASFKVYKHSVDASNHITNNILNLLQLIIIQSKKKQVLPEDLVENIETSLEEGKEQMKVLNSIENPLEEKQYREIFPK